MFGGALVRRVLRAADCDATVNLRRPLVRLRSPRAVAQVVRQGGGRVPVSDCVSFLGVGFDSGYHPIVNTMRELLDNPGLSYAESSLRAHHASFQPRSMEQLFFPSGGIGGRNSWQVGRFGVRYIDTFGARHPGRSGELLNPLVLMRTTRSDRCLYIRR